MSRSAAHQPVGIFDSGVGGLTVFSAIRRLLPNESLVYLGDTARVPYGTKSAETVIRYALEDAAFLVEQNVKAIVVACNTVSSCALLALAERFDMPIIGVIEPGVDAALAVTKNQRIGVIGTSATIKSGAYERLFRERRGDLQVSSIACPLFVPLVEEGWCDDPVAASIAERYLSPLRYSEIDTLILGCTHYPLLLPMLRQLLEGVAFIDSASAVAASLRHKLATHGLLSAGGTACCKLYVTDAPSSFTKIATTLLPGLDAPLSQVSLKAFPP